MDLMLNFTFFKIPQNEDIKNWETAFGSKMLSQLKDKDVHFKKIYDCSAFQKIITTLDRLKIPYKILVDREYILEHLSPKLGDSANDQAGGKAISCAKILRNSANSIISKIEEASYPTDSKIKGFMDLSELLDNFMDNNKLVTEMNTETKDAEDSSTYEASDNSQEYSLEKKHSGEKDGAIKYEINSLVGEIQEINVKVNELSARLEEYRELGQDQNIHNRSELTDSIANLNVDVKERYNEIQDRFNSFEESVQSLSQKLDNKIEIIESLSSEFNELNSYGKRKYESLEDQIGSMTPRLEEVFKDVSNVKSIIATVDDKEQLEQLQETLDRMSNEFSRYKEKADSLSQQLSNYREDTSEIINRVENMKSEIIQEVAIAPEKISDLDSKVDNIEKDLSTFSKQFEQKLAASENENSKLIEETHALDKNLKEILEKLNNFENAGIGSIEKVEALETEMKEFQATHEESIGNLRSRIKTSNAKLDNCFMTLAEVGRHVEEMKESDNDIDRFKNDFNEIVGLINELSSRFVNLENTVKNDKKLNSEIKERISGIEGELDLKSDVLNKEIDSFNNKASSLFANVMGALERLELVENTVEDLNSDLKSMDKDFREYSDAIENISDKLKDFERSVTNIPKYVETNERLNGAFTDLRKDYKDLLIQNKHIITELDILKEKEPRIDIMEFMELKENYRNLLDNYETLLASNRETQVKNRILNEEHKTLTAKLDTINTELSGLKPETSVFELNEKNIKEPGIDDHKTRSGKFFSKAGLSIIALLVFLGLLYFFSGFEEMLFAGFQNAAPQQEGQTTFIVDNFLNNTNNWYENKSIFIKNGQYRINNSDADKPVVLFNQNWKFEDFIYQAKFMKEDGNDNFLYGLVFRVQDPDNFYLLGVTGGGRYIFTKRMNGAWNLVKPIEDLVPSRHISKGNQENLLKVICKKNYYELYINEYPVGVVKDETLSLGMVGFYVDKDLKVAVDEISISELSNELNT
ncbi:hypothetical protein JXI42_13705 [bacterium]|nr:hypothetical protein [bacterium]